MLCVALDEFDFFFGEVVEFVDELVDSLVGGINLALDFGLLVRDFGGG